MLWNATAVCQCALVASSEDSCLRHAIVAKKTHVGVLLQLQRALYTLAWYLQNIACSSDQH